MKAQPRMRVSGVRKIMTDPRNIIVRLCVLSFKRLRMSEAVPAARTSTAPLELKRRAYTVINARAALDG
jgi:hypothetical protein